MSKEIKRKVWPDQAPNLANFGETDNYTPYKVGCYEGWRRAKNNPILHLNFENGNDPCVLKVNGEYYMYFTWRTLDRISLMKSKDGENWRGPLISFLPQQELAWEGAVMHPSVIYKDGIFEMWYTAKTKERDTFTPGMSRIAHAISKDGITWEREYEPVFEAELIWEEYSVAYPWVIFDDSVKKYKMWYCAGQYDFPQLMGYAESDDGMIWERKTSEPIINKKVDKRWEREAATMGTVVKEGDIYYMLYCGFEHVTNSRLGLARSKDGIHWEEHPGNPIITGGKQGWWDGGYTTRACLLHDDGVWKMWYTGHFHDMTNIGMMTNDNPEIF